MRTAESPMGIDLVRAREQTRARYPDQDGHVERDGVRVFYERYGKGEPTILFLPTWSIVHSRCWKAQIPYFARHFRVLSFDGRGNGRSDRPAGAECYAEAEFAADAFAVMDATGTARTWLVSLSMGAQRALLLAANHPERVAGLVFIAPAVPLPPSAPRDGARESFDRRRDGYRGWQKYNRHFWVEHYEDFLRFFFSQVATEPHSTKQQEDGVGWALETDPRTLIATALAPQRLGARPGRARAPSRLDEIAHEQVDLHGIAGVGGPTVPAARPNGSPRCSDAQLRGFTRD